MVRRHAYSWFMVLILLTACAGNRHKQEEKIRKVLESSGAYHIQRGTAATDSGFHDRAIRHFKEAIRLIPYEPTAYNNLGVAFFRIGLLDSALHAYQAALRMNSTYIRAYINIAQVYLKQNEYALVIAATDKAIGIDPENPNSYMIKALAYEELGHRDDAISVYQKGVTVLPDNAVLRHNLGTLYFDKGLIREAIIQFERAQSLDPDNAETYFNLGNVYTRKCQLDKALEYYETAILKHPGMISALNNRGLIYMAQNRAKDALDDFKRAFLMDPDAVTVQYNLSLAMDRLDSLERALDYVNQAIRGDSSMSMFYIHRGNLLMRLEQTEEAIATLLKAIELEPALAIGYHNLGRALMTARAPDKARVLLEKAIELFPDYLESRYFTQSKYVSQGMSDLLGACAEAVDIATDYAHMFNNLGHVYLMMNLDDSAVIAFKRATGIQPGMVESFENLAQVYRKQGKKKLADDALARARLNRAMILFSADSLALAELFCQQALSLKPDFAEAYARLGSIYHRSGHTDATEHAFNKALNLDQDNSAVHLIYGDYLSTRQLWDRAVEHYRHVIRLTPRSIDARERLVDVLTVMGEDKDIGLEQAEIHYLRGKKSEYTGQWDSAFEEYSTASALNPGEARYYASLGLIQAKKHLHKQGESLFRQALDIDPENPEAHYGLGLIYGDQRNYEQAIAHLHQAVSVDPFYAKAHYALAVNYYFTDHISNAREHLEKAKNLGLIIKQEFSDELSKDQP